MILKRYLLFIGDKYYPEGGWRDFVASSDSLEEIEKLIKDHECLDSSGWGHVIDTETDKLWEFGWNKRKLIEYLDNTLAKFSTP